MTKDKSIFIKNIYYMLSYAFTALNQGGYENVATEEFDNLHNLFAAILAKGIGRQLKQGLYREYLSRKEDITVMRGKIDMPGTIQNRLAKKRVLTCEYDELSENNLLNRILKTTVMILLRHANVNAEYKTDLKKEMLFFFDVDTIDPASVNWTSIRFQRNNSTYRMLISLCQLVLEGMLMTTDAGEYKLADFVDEQRMSRLYEKFILEYYAKECPHIKAAAAQIPWGLDDGIGTMLPVMQSDIMLSKDNKVLIIDAKYYTHTTQTQYDVHTLHSNNLYQIFTYVKNKDIEFGENPHTVSGMLLYARTDETIQPNNVYRMSGNQISVNTLDLNQNFSKIAAQLNAIADEHFKQQEGDINMATIKEIHDFAVKYHNLYVNPQTTEREVRDGFDDLCFAFGFEMDCGNKFIETFSSDAFHKNTELDKVINSIDDVALLGSAIFSHWRYVTYWTYHSSLLDEEHRPWFITAFGRLAVITEE